MPVVERKNVPRDPFKGGATYQTLVGDQAGSTPIRVGIQTSPPGYKTPLHSHPYMETVTVLEGEAEAWLGDQSEIVKLRAGTTLVIPANLHHWFRATGEQTANHSGAYTHRQSGSSSSTRSEALASPAASRWARGPLSRRKCDVERPFGPWRRQGVGGLPTKVAQASHSLRV